MTSIGTLGTLLGSVRTLAQKLPTNTARAARAVRRMWQSEAARYRRLNSLAVRLGEEIREGRDEGPQADYLRREMARLEAPRTPHPFAGKFQDTRQRARYALRNTWYNSQKRHGTFRQPYGAAELIRIERRQFARAMASKAWRERPVHVAS